MQDEWRLYEPQTLKSVVADLLTNYWVGANAFEFLFDLSFKRHGALLVFDPEHRILDHVVNPVSGVASGKNTADLLRQALKTAVVDVRMGEKNGLTAKKRLMMELASMDGAIVFDAANVLAIGAMVETHAKAGNEAGARTTAARSALEFGAHPIKVSADGEIEVFLASDPRFGRNRLSFL